MTRSGGTLSVGFTPFPPDYEQRYRDRGYWTGQSLGHVSTEWATKTPRATAIVTVDGETISFADLEIAVARRTAGLAAYNCGHGDRVVLHLPNSPEIIITLLALFRLGTVPVLALPPHRSSDIAYFCNAIGASVYITTDTHGGYDHREIARRITSDLDDPPLVLIDGDAGEFARLDANDAAKPVQNSPGAGPEIAFFLLSGGTTGRPKLIPRTHDDYGYQIRATAKAMEFGAGETYLAALSVAHNAALGCPGMLGALAAGGCVALLPAPAPDLAFEMFQRTDAKLTTLMPQILAVWADASEAFDIDMSGLTVEVGGARLDPGLYDAVQSTLGCRISHWFGMSEGFLAFTRLNDPAERARRSQGKPLSPDDEWKIVDDSGQLVAPGEFGELLVRGPTTIRGYFNAADENARSFTPDGFLRTKDRARFNGYGDLEVSGRLDERVNRAGEKVSPDEVEEHLMLHPDIKDVCVLALPDAVLGERTLAVLRSTSNTVDRQAVCRFLTDIGLAEFKHPDQVERMDELPKTKIGKTDRAALRRTFGAIGMV